MKNVIVKTFQGSYSILIGANSLQRLQKEITKLKLFRNVFVIIDENVRKFHADNILNILNDYFPKLEIYVLKPGETSKSHDELHKIYSKLIKSKYSRNSLIIAIGGGVTGDISGYAASTYMRGVQLIHIPTTLLADADSSIGGKTGINFDKMKNIIGSFYQPKLVLIDPDFLITLPEEEMLSGLGEVIKYSFITNQRFYDYTYNNLDNILLKRKSVLEKIIYESVLFKASVVAADEKETGLREILNFGHTYAHAFESELNFKIKHGEAVIAGIISALFLSNLKGYLKSELLRKFLVDIKRIRLSRILQKINPEKVLDIMQSDKKNRNNKIKFVLVKNIGEIVTEVEANKSEIVETIFLMKEFLNN
jgi:3-dehydroquinate synthase